MSVDDRLKRLPNLQTTNRVVAQHRIRGVAKSEATNHDVQLALVVILLTVIGKANFLCGEKIGHQVLIVKQNLKHIHFKTGNHRDDAVISGRLALADIQSL